MMGLGSRATALPVSLPSNRVGNLQTLPAWGKNKRALSERVDIQSLFLIDQVQRNTDQQAAPSSAPSNIPVPNVEELLRYLTPSAVHSR